MKDIGDEEMRRRVGKQKRDGEIGRQAQYESGGTGERIKD